MTEMDRQPDSEVSMTVQIKKLIGYVSETSDEEDQVYPEPTPLPCPR